MRVWVLFCNNTGRMWGYATFEHVSRIVGSKERAEKLRDEGNERIRRREEWIEDGGLEYSIKEFEVED